MDSRFDGLVNDMEAFENGVVGAEDGTLLSSLSSLSSVMGVRRDDDDVCFNCEHCWPGCPQG